MKKTEVLINGEVTSNIWHSIGNRPWSAVKTPVMEDFIPSGNVLIPNREYYFYDCPEVYNILPKVAIDKLNTIKKHKSFSETSFLSWDGTNLDHYSILCSTCIKENDYTQLENRSIGDIDNLVENFHRIDKKFGNVRLFVRGKRSQNMSPEVYYQISFDSLDKDWIKTIFPDREDFYEIGRRIYEKYKDIKVLISVKSTQRGLYTEVYKISQEQNS